MLSPEDLRRQLLAAGENDQRGEELFGAWLTAIGHKDEDFTWVSRTRARSAYDYEVYAARWLAGAPHVFINVKATRASFDHPVHMSISELHFAASAENYRIARLYNLAGDTPRLQVLTGVQAVAARILERLDPLPDEIAVNSLRIDPRVFEAELETKIHLSPEARRMNGEGQLN